MRQGVRWGFAGQRDDLADLLGAEIAGAPRPRPVGQDRLNRGAELLGLARPCGECVVGVDPTAAPLPDTVFIESQGLRNLLVVLTVGGLQHHLRALHQAVGGFAAPGEPFQ